MVSIEFLFEHSSESLIFQFSDRRNQKEIRHFRDLDQIFQEKKFLTSFL